MNVLNGFYNDIIELLQRLTFDNVNVIFSAISAWTSKSQMLEETGRVRNVRCDNIKTVNTCSDFITM